MNPNRSRCERHRPSSDRGFATFLVLWAVIVGAIVLVAIQVTAGRQAADGRRQVAKIRAYWAAHAGVETQIASMTFNTLQPNTNSAITLSDDLAAAATGELDQARFEIHHERPTERHDGAADAHAKINVNTASREDFLLLPDMDESIADSILDWIDADDDAREFGAEAGQYLGLRWPYLPRNGPMRSIRELELIVGVRPEFVRGEDWNLNGTLDGNEDDGDASWPPDNADGKLDAGWSAILTASSAGGPGWAASGQARLDLTTASDSDIQTRLGVDSAQANAILQAAQSNTDLTLADFISTDLSQLSTGGSGTTLLSGGSGGVQNLTREQLRALLDEAWVGDPNAPEDGLAVNQGKVNINTLDEEMFQYLSGVTTAQADAIILERQGRSGGFVSMADLLDVPSITTQTLATLYDLFDVRSNVYVVTSKGIDSGTGLEVEIVATLDRSRLPVEIRRQVVR